MKKRLLRLLLVCTLFTASLLILLLFLFAGCCMQDQLPALRRAVLLSLLPGLPLLLLVVWFLARLGTKKLANSLNSMDLTHPDQSKIDRELDPLAKKIEKQNEVIAAQMEQLREESANRESLRREFTANVSHEMKTPLTTISGTAEILRSGMVRPEDVSHFADNIYRESQRMTTLVNDILRISQLEEVSPNQKKELVDLYGITQDVLSWLQDAAKQKNVTLSLTGTHSVVLGSEKTLSDMVFNLCDNAIKYNRDSGWVKVTVRDSGKQVRLTVTDTGIGIPKEHQERVFERFYRVDKSHSREIGGTGLGLSIVKHGAIFHGAEVTLRSRVNTGTIISLTFPSPSEETEQ